MSALIDEIDRLKEEVEILNRQLRERDDVTEARTLFDQGYNDALDGIPHRSDKYAYLNGYSISYETQEKASHGT